MIRLVFSLGLLTLCPLARGATTPQIIPIEQIRPGMTGYGLTVFSGFKIERFKVVVIDVIRNFLPKQDLFLVRVDHPVLRHAGVVGGMSGSPIYLEGKLAGALAYGWRFAKDPVCGITPIKDMLALLKRQERGPLQAGWAAAPRQPADPLALAAAERSRRLWRLPFAKSPPPATTLAAPVAVPLNVAGISAPVVAELKEAFAGFGFEPVQGGGTGQAEGPSEFSPGGSLGVQLVSGDMSMAGTGTVTWVNSNQVLAFGHRMFNAGEIYVPAVTSRVHYTMPSVARSFKIASPARVVGSLVQDRQPGIMVNTEKHIGTVPMKITMRFQKERREFKVELAHHRLLTPTLASTALSSALTEAISDVTQATFKILTRFTVRGHPPVVIEDWVYTPGGVAMAAAVFSQGLRALREVMSSEFEPAIIERIDMEVDVRFGNEVVEVVAVSTSSATVDPGSRVNLAVTFRPFGGKEFVKTFPLEIPPYLAGSLLKLEVASGSETKPIQAPPQDMGQLLTSLQEGFSGRSLVLSLATPDFGIKLRGEVIRDLPLSAVDSLTTASSARSEDQFRTVLHQVHGTERVIAGKRSLRLRVRSEVLK